MKAATEIKITEATTYTEFPQIAAEEGILAKLQANRSEVSGRRNELIQHTIENAKSARTREQAETKLIAGALTLSADSDNRAIDTVFTREIQELNRKEGQLNAAIELQRKKLDTLRYDAGRQICQVFIPKHRAQQRRIGLALIALLQEIEAEHQLIEGIRDRGIEAVGSYLPISIPRGKFGRLKDLAIANDVAGYLMQSFVESGALTKAEVEKAARS